jgi:hypothetical protein
MLWRTTLIVAATFGAVDGAHAELVRYRLEVTPTGPQAAPSAVMNCPENSLCEGRIELLIDKRRQPVTVFAFFERGNAYIMFRTDRIVLFVGRQQYGAIPIGPSRVVHEELTITEPTPQALEDAQGALYRRPVVRAPARFIASVDIDIKPGN